ncbi:hypothetical protein FRC14_007390 [Serendipita sp. 396]|nr:hypothetical protein FRC14_007390 [Serendipita sp. 396]
MDILNQLFRLFAADSSKNVPAGSIVDSTTEIQSILRNLPVTAPEKDIALALKCIANSIPEDGLPLSQVTNHVLEELARGFARGQSGPRYFGFVTGGALPAAQCGDILTTIYDQNVQVHLPTDTISTALEHRTLQLVLDLLSIPRATFTGQSLSSGATGSNILGLLCGRDHAIRKAIGDAEYSVADNGYPAGITIKVLTDRHHASIEKAAAIIGIGRKNVVSLVLAQSERFVDCLERQLEQYRTSPGKVATIVTVSFGEVNTGDFTDIRGVREVCDRYDAWLHIDAAFGALACLLPEYSHLSGQIACADSLTLDAHKSFNVPYAAGIFYTRDRALLTSILAGSTIPTYLAAASQPRPEDFPEWVDTVASPLHTNLENSRRFIALPLYCALINMGRKGYTELMNRNIQFARDLAAWMLSGQGEQWYEVLNLMEGADGEKCVPLNVVLFRPRDTEDIPAIYRRSHYSSKPERASSTLIQDINRTKGMYVSPGAYALGAVRIAVSNWTTGLNDDGEDLKAVKKILRNIMLQDPRLD